jgi:cytidylate kinase
MRCCERQSHKRKTRLMYSLLIVTGPPGAGKSSVARLLADGASPSVLVDGDTFFGFLATGAIAPWLPEAHQQNTVVTQAAALAAGAFARAGFDTVFDGIVGPWLLPLFATAADLGVLDYVVLLPPVDVCQLRVAARQGHGFTDQAATAHMHHHFATAEIDHRHVVTDAASSPTAIAAIIQAARQRGDLRYTDRD